MVRHVQPAKPSGSYLIASSPNWWKLNDTTSWLEPKFGGMWVTPMPPNDVVARIDMRVQNGPRFTVGSFDGENLTRIGYVSQFGGVTKQVTMTVTEGTAGMTGESAIHYVNIKKHPTSTEPSGLQCTLL